MFDTFNATKPVNNCLRYFVIQTQVKILKMAHPNTTIHQILSKIYHHEFKRLPKKYGFRYKIESFLAGVNFSAHREAT